MGAILLFALAFRCGRSADVVAVYNGGELTRPQLEARVMALPEARRTPPKGTDVPTWEQLLARQTVLERLLVPPARLVPAEAGVLNPGPWRSLLVRELMEREGLRRVEIPEDAVRSYYEQNWSRFFLPEGVLFQHIFLPFDPGSGPADDAQVRALADSLRSLALSGVSFEDLVARWSRSESKAWQGRVGAVYRGQLEKSFEEALFSLQEEEVGPIRTEHGYHVVKILERREEELKPFAEVASVIRRELALGQLASMRDSYLEGLQKSYPVHVDATALNQPAPDSAVVLEVGGWSVSKGEVERWLSQLHRQPADTTDLAQLLEAVGREAQLYQAACAKGIDGDRVVAERYRAAIGGAIADSMLGARLMGMEISETELRKHYDDHQMRFSQPKTWRASEIVLVPSEGERYQTWRTALSVAERARAGADFAELARRYSAAPSAEQGGSLGVLTLWDTARRGPEFQKALFALGVGETSPVVRYDDGYLILKLEGVSEPEGRPYDEVREAVRSDYLERNREALLEELADQVLSDAGFRFVGS
jgi:parvulin-like peptidyl-prolyl isomerase